MSNCDLDSPAPDWIIEHPATLAVFQEFGIDYSCGGKSLAYACRQEGLDDRVVLQKLLDCLNPEESDPATHGEEKKLFPRPV